MGGMKVCKTCDEAKAMAEFHRSSTTLDGRTGSCRACRNLAQREYRKSGGRGAARRRAIREYLQHVCHKRCGSCDVIKQLDKFHLDRASSDGHSSHCKACKARRG